MGAALTHQPAPEGEVLEVSVTITGKPKPKDSVVIPFARWGGRVFATDYIEYDLAVAKDSPLKGFYYSPFKGNDSKEAKLDFKKGEGLDQFGREQVSGPEPKGGASVWEHRVIGLSSYGPGILPGHAIVFKGAKPGTYKLYLDNLRLRHADGSTTPIWTSGKDTRKPKVEDTEFFKDIKVRTVSADQIK